MDASRLRRFATGVAVAAVMSAPVVMSAPAHALQRAGAYANQDQCQKANLTYRRNGASTGACYWLPSQGWYFNYSA